MFFIAGAEHSHFIVLVIVTRGGKATTRIGAVRAGAEWDQFGTNRVKVGYNSTRVTAADTFSIVSTFYTSVLTCKVDMKRSVVIGRKRGVVSLLIGMNVFLLIGTKRGGVLFLVCYLCGLEFV